MNKLLKSILAILGGMDIFIYIMTPIILATLWVSITGLIEWRSYVFYGVGLLATLFRAIKIGILKYKDDRN